MVRKQAKVLSKTEVTQVLDHIKNYRYPKRNKVIFLLSLKAGLRAQEISLLTWSMLTDASGQINDFIQLPDKLSKGKSGRTIPLNTDLKKALIDLYQSNPSARENYVIVGERGSNMLPCNISHWFCSTFKKLGLKGCSSHSGRRTFVINAAKRIIEVGGSLRDVQQLTGHASLHTTQHYVEEDAEAKQKVVQLI
ncbi:MAG: site-specific integrase [Alphaproteobacteria bacterium]|nr:site-specific integrase [Alphaproteobacteria bacterium]